MRLAMIGIAFACAAMPSEAQETVEPPITVEVRAGMPDPSTIEVPLIIGGRDEDVVRNGWKHFYFWRADTPYEQAYADFADCYRFLPRAGGNPEVPSFIVWKGAEDFDQVETVYPSPYGVVGAVVVELLSGPIERRASQSRMRRCLEPRGYQRFPAPEETWEQIIDNYSPASIGVSARLASGPRPDAEPLPETR